MRIQASGPSTPTCPSLRGPRILRAAGPFSRDMAAMAEMSYLFTEPLLVDTRASVEDLGVAPTALEDAVRRSIATRVDAPRPGVRAS